jgi:hypothetical protein
MNNDTNKIMGIGLIINYPFYNKYKIYKNGNDRYIYKSNKYLSFQNIQIPNPNPNPDPTSFKIEELQLTIDVLEQLCFYGNEHLKRGSGLQIFPIKYLYRLREHLNIVKILSDLFEINTNEPARTQ